MTEKSKKKTAAGRSRKIGQPRPPVKPDWAKGLQRLYDSVVEEPLPDSFKELLSKLDDAN